MSVRPYFDDGRCVIYNGDCREVLEAAGLAADCVITDPPYSSGGFQEAGRSAGSIGTTRSEGGLPRLRADNLSTRGYRRLIREVIDRVAPQELYMFTDWRMWIESFDCAEDAGLRVRAMVVWDKLLPGMGSPWRGQHELILYAVRDQPDPQWGSGNVIGCARSGNQHHPTEKPVGLIESLLRNSKTARSVLDPFMGSGTTLVAARNLGRRAIGIEIEERYCEIAAERLGQQVLDFGSVAQ